MFIRVNGSHFKNRKALRLYYNFLPQREALTITTNGCHGSPLSSAPGAWVSTYFLPTPAMDIGQTKPTYGRSKNRSIVASE